MSNLSDLLKNLQVKDGAAVQLAGNALGTLADLAGGIGGAASAISGAIDLITNKQDEMVQKLDEVLNEIHNDFGELKAEQRAQHILDRLNNLDPAIADALKVFQTLKADLAAQPPLPEFARLEQIQTCLGAVDLLNNDDKWKTNFFDEIYYSDPWSGDIKPDPDTDGLAFSKRFILPQFLRVLYLFETVGLALEPDFLAKFRESTFEGAEGFVARLQKVYDVSLEGIVPIRTPKREELFIEVPLEHEYQTISDGKGGEFLANAWNGGIPSTMAPEFFQMYGAVDKYAGFNSVGNFPPLPVPFPDTNPPPDEEYFARFFARHSLSTSKRVKEVYAGLGLGDLRTTINTLRRLLGDAPLGDFDANLYWSLRDTISALGDAAAVPSTSPDLSLFDTVKRMNIIGNVDTSQDFLVSWRGALDACAV
jgi:hypothetical protein